MNLVVGGSMEEDTVYGGIRYGCPVHASGFTFFPVSLGSCGWIVFRWEAEHLALMEVVLGRELLRHCLGDIMEGLLQGSLRAS